VSSKKLTHAKIAKTRKPGLLGDGDGLWVFVSKLKKDGKLSKRFVFRYRVAGRYGEVPIGKFSDVSLEAARVRAAEFRAQIAKGDDPASERRAARGKTAAPIAALTFKAATLDYIEAVGRSKWRTLKNAQVFLGSFERHVFPRIGDTAIANVSDNEAQAVLKPLFARSAALGRKVQSRAKAVYDRARVMKATPHPNPFEWRGYLSHVYPAPPPHTHLRAIKWQNLPNLFGQLVVRGDDIVALAARFQIALALRPSEARRARFDMIDEAAGTISFVMTKNGKPFVAPLSPAALAVVKRVTELRTNDYLFPGRGPNKPINDSALCDLIKSLTGGATAHGVARSCFADWAYENDAASDTVIEASLNHATGSATVRAYKRGNVLELRRKLMDRYSDFLTGVSNVVAFRANAAAPQG
jgi:integrase